MLRTITIANRGPSARAPPGPNPQLGYAAKVSSTTGAAGSPCLPTKKGAFSLSLPPKLMTTPDSGGGGVGGVWAGGLGSSSNGGESRRASNTGSYDSRVGSTADSRMGSNAESLYSDTDVSDTSPRQGPRYVASALAVAAPVDNEDGSSFGGGGDAWRGGGIFGGGAGGGPVVERRKTLSRSTVFAGVDEGMGCIDEEDPEQLDT